MDDDNTAWQQVEPTMRYRKKNILVSLVACMLLLTACGSTAANVASQPTIPPTVVPTPTDTPTPTPSFPAIGEWVDNTPHSLTNDDFALVIDIQQANSTSNVASITSIVGECVYDHVDQNGNVVNIPKPYTYTASASDSINGSDITLSANVAYFDKGIKIIYGMQFVGTINSDGSLLLASSQLYGVQDYTFGPTTGAVAQMHSQFQQASCNR